jgi:hypothetical protein
MPQAGGGRSPARRRALPGEEVPGLFDVTVDATVTACLPPGDYRFHVAYLQIDVDGDSEEFIDEASILLHVTATVAADPTPSVVPPSPTPLPPVAGEQGGG